VVGNDWSYGGVISPDGRWAGFSSLATNLVPDDTNADRDAFVHDLTTGATILVNRSSTGEPGDSWSEGPVFSADGRFVAFASQSSNLVPGDLNFWADVFVRDLHTGTTTLASLTSTGAQANFPCIGASISADGRHVAFFSGATNLVPGDANGADDVFVRDLARDETNIVSISTEGTQGNGASFHPVLSPSARYVAFGSEASDLVPADTNGWKDVFVHDLITKVTSRVSVGSLGSQANGESFGGPLSTDGRTIAFSSQAAGGESSGYSWSAALSADGRHVAFASHATDLVADDTNGVADVFVRDQGEPPVFASCFGDGSGATCPCGNLGALGRGCENSALTGGAALAASGSASLAADTLVLTASSELPNVLSIFLQGSEMIAPAVFGDGLRCAGGSLKRLYTKHAVAGVVSAPELGDPSISERSAALGAPIPMGATRHYQTYYRDPALTYCPSPSGNTWNVGHALSTVWSP
jgi:hypothetical protein